MQFQNFLHPPNNALSFAVPFRSAKKISLQIPESTLRLDFYACLREFCMVWLKAGKTEATRMMFDHGSTKQPIQRLTGYVNGCAAQKTATTVPTIGQLFKRCDVTRRNWCNRAVLTRFRAHEYNNSPKIKEKYNGDVVERKNSFHRPNPLFTFSSVCFTFARGGGARPTSTAAPWGSTARERKRRPGAQLASWSMTVWCWAAVELERDFRILSIRNYHVRKSLTTSSDRDKPHKLSASGRCLSRTSWFFYWLSLRQRFECERSTCVRVQMQANKHNSVLVPRPCCTTLNRLLTTLMRANFWAACGHR